MSDVSYITPEDVEARNGEPVEVPGGVVQRWIDVAHAELRRLDPAIDNRVSLGELGRAVVVNALVESVWRCVQDNLIGYRVRSETWPETTTMYKDAEAWGIYFTESEMNSLGIKAPGTATRGAFGFRPSFRGGFR